MCTASDSACIRRASRASGAGLVAEDARDLLGSRRQHPEVEHRRSLRAIAGSAASPAHRVGDAARAQRRRAGRRGGAPSGPGRSARAAPRRAARARRGSAARGRPRAAAAGARAGPRAGRGRARRRRPAASRSASWKQASKRPAAVQASSSAALPSARRPPARRTSRLWSLPARLASRLGAARDGAGEQQLRHRASARAPRGGRAVDAHRAAADRGEDLVADRVVDDAGERAARVLARDAHGEQRDARAVVGGAVERLHEPAQAGAGAVAAVPHPDGVARAPGGEHARRGGRRRPLGRGRVVAVGTAEAGRELARRRRAPRRSRCPARRRAPVRRSCACRQLRGGRRGARSVFTGRTPHGHRGATRVPPGR